MGVGYVLLTEEGVALLSLVQRIVTPKFAAADAKAIKAPAWVLKLMPKFTSISSGRLAILRSFSTTLFGLRARSRGRAQRH